MAINKTTATGKGLRTALQSVVGSFVGLALAIWAVPGVPDAVANYVTANWLPLLLSIGVPTGIVAWLQNRAEGDR